MHTETHIVELCGVRLKNASQKARRWLALDLDYFRIDRAEVVFVLGMRGAGKSVLHDVIESIFNWDNLEGENVTIPQRKSDKPAIHINELWRAAGVQFRSQTGKKEDVPAVDGTVLLYCDDPTNESCPTGPGIIDLVLERKHAMLIGTDPDRVEVTLHHFLQRDAGRILWLDKGTIYFDGNSEEFWDEKRRLCESLQPAGTDSDKQFLLAVLNV